ncbi:MAG TPA: FUSC family protein [Saliniramus sp.]|nr:FUSC family protein [Saliniramus sp.]
MRLRDVLSFRLDRESRRDVARISLQTLVASGVTYALLTWLGWPHVSWAVISAIFVIQLNSDTSIISGLGRIAGTVMGTMFGLAATQILPGDDGAFLRVAITTALASGIATIWPNLRYGAVAAAAIAVQSHPEFADAIGQAVAISVGAVLGTAATILVWPELGRNRVLRMLEFALHDCSEYLGHVLAESGGVGKETRQAIHGNFVDHMATARSVLKDTRIRNRLKSGPPLRDLVGAVDRLWYGLSLLDRAIGHEEIDLRDEERGYLKGHVTEVQREARAFIETLVTYLQDDKPLPQSDAVQRAIRKAQDAAEANLREAQESERHGRTIRVLLFALEEMGDNLSDLEGFVGKPEGGS